MAKRTKWSHHIYKQMVQLQSIFLLKILLIIHFCIVECKPRTHQTTLDEYRKVLPTAIFERFRAIYMDKSLTNIKKLELLDEMFIALPDELLKRLPVPAAFRKLPPAQQKRVHRIYYSKKIGFDDKMRELGQLITRLSTDQQRRLMPIHPVEEGHPNKHIPTLVEFDVPVLLQFNGHLETHLLQAYMDLDNFSFLRWLVGKKGIDEMSRARLVGVLLKQTYQMDPDNFPLPLNGDSHEITDDIRNLGVRLMFGQNPFDRVDPFKAKLQTLRRLFAKRTKEGKLPNVGEATIEPASDFAEVKNSGWIDRLEMFPEANLFELQQNDDKAFTAQKFGPMFGSLDKFFAIVNGTMHWDWHGDDFGQNATNF